MCMYCKCWGKIKIYTHGTKSGKNEFKCHLKGWFQGELFDQFSNAV